MRDSGALFLLLALIADMADRSDSRVPDLLNDASSETGAALEEAQSFETFFQANKRSLAGFLRKRVATEEDAQEISQESYTRLLGYGYGDSRPPSVWRALLYRIASNLASSRLRSDRAHNGQGRQSIDDTELLSDAPSQERIVATQQEWALVREAIGALSPKCRQVFLLSRVHHKTYPQIAEHCGISVKMVEKYISQALAALRAKLGDRA